jgi:hypothetical protein
MRNLLLALCGLVCIVGLVGCDKEDDSSESSSSTCRTCSNGKCRRARSVVTTEATSSGTIAVAVPAEPAAQVPAQFVIKAVARPDGTAEVVDPTSEVKKAETPKVIQTFKVSAEEARGVVRVTQTHYDTDGKPYIILKEGEPEPIGIWYVRERDVPKEGDPIRVSGYTTCQRIAK